MPQILLNLQAKQEHEAVLQSVRTADTQVSHIAKHLPQITGSNFAATFLQRKRNSWQAHLERISRFLVQGEGVWWKHVEGGYQFLDGDSDPDHQCGPALHHFRHSMVHNVETERKECWSRIISERILIPTDKVRVYDDAGILVGQMIYTGLQASTQEPMQESGQRSQQSLWNVDRKVTNLPLAL